ncbi:hypothetical protein CKO23_23135 [Thiocystis violacea]|nr:hypothetical protein [Thiocystis violacea]
MRDVRGDLICAEISGPSRQGEPLVGAKGGLRLAIELIPQDRTADMLRGLPSDGIRDTLLVG